MNTFYIDKIGLPEEAQEKVSVIYRKYGSDTDFLSFEELLKAGDFTQSLEKIKIFSEKNNESKYEISLTVLVTNLSHMKDAYDKKGIPEKIFLDCAKDLSYKANECKTVWGVYGVEPFEWYKRFYEANIFSIGRLQFEIIPFPFDDYTKGEITVKKGDRAINMHIPSSGKLPMEEFNASLLDAYNYFKGDSNRVVFVCRSWLLYDKYKERVYNKDSNLYKFANSFDLVWKCTSEDFDQGWRVFGVSKIDDPDKLPQSTSLQKSFVSYIKSGGDFGYGGGIIIIEDGVRK